MARERRKRTLVPVLDATARASLWYLAWSVPPGVALLLEPPLALAVMVAHTAAFLSYPRLGRRRWRRRRAATLHLRSVRPAAARLSLALPALLLGHLVLQLLQLRMSPVSPPAPPAYAFAALPLGGLVVPFYAIVGAPLVEEFAFRGHLQGRVARHLGQPVAAALAGAIFAAIHMNSAWLLYYFVAGVLFAYVLVATRSIWGAVIAHSAMNAFVTLLNGAPARWLLAHAQPAPTAALAAVALLLLVAAAGILKGSGRSTQRERTGTVSPVTGDFAADTAGTPGATSAAACRTA